MGAALAPDIAVLAAFRAVQGGGGVVFPLTFSLARAELPASRVDGAIGKLTAAFGLRTAAGFALGGLLAQLVGWRWVFAAGGAVIAVSLGAAWRLVPAARRRRTAPSTWRAPCCSGPRPCRCCWP